MYFLVLLNTDLYYIDGSNGGCGWILCTPENKIGISKFGVYRRIEVKYVNVFIYRKLSSH